MSNEAPLSKKYPGLIIGSNGYMSAVMKAKKLREGGYITHKNCLTCGVKFELISGRQIRCPTCAIIAKKGSDRINSRNQSQLAKNKRDSLRGSPSNYGQSKIDSALRSIRHQRKLMAEINARLDNVDKMVEKCYLDALHHSWVNANKEALKRDRWRRSKKRRRDGDSNADRGCSRNPSLWVRSMRRFGYRCAYCGITAHQSEARGFGLQLDHLVPVGSLPIINGDGNSVPACIWCNGSKQDKDVLEWAADKGMILSYSLINMYVMNICPYAA